MKRFSFLMIIMAAVVMAVGARQLPERRLTHCGPGNMAPDSVIRVAVDSGASVAVEARAALVSERRNGGLSSRCWGLRFDNGLVLTLRGGNTDFGQESDREFYRVSASVGDSVIAFADVERGFDSRSGHFNTLEARFLPDGACRIGGGGDFIHHIMTFPLADLPRPRSVELWSSNSALRPSYVAVERTQENSLRRMPQWSPDSLQAYLASTTDPMEGYWRYLDRENDPRHAVPGGHYTLATVSDGEGGYSLVLVDGAEINPEIWESGAEKGHLHRTIFVDSFDLDWTDAQGFPLDDEAHASFDANRAILTLTFPLSRAVLRFSRVR